LASSSSSGSRDGHSRSTREAAVLLERGGRRRERLRLRARRRRRGGVAGERGARRAEPARGVEQRVERRVREAERLEQRRIAVLAEVGALQRGEHRVGGVGRRYQQPQQLARAGEAALGRRRAVDRGGGGARGAAAPLRRRGGA